MFDISRSLNHQFQHYNEKIDILNEQVLQFCKLVPCNYHDRLTDIDDIILPLSRAQVWLEQFPELEHT